MPATGRASYQESDAQPGELRLGVSTAWGVDRGGRDVAAACYVIYSQVRSTPGVVRYADGGGLTAWGRAVRERVGLQAAAMFEQRLPAGKISARLRVSPKSRSDEVGGRRILHGRVRA